MLVFELGVFRKKLNEKFIGVEIVSGLRVEALATVLIVSGSPG
ncbi:MAG TPA: hypothetical protein VIT00_03650 [Terrimicrobiaceae bacterium]